MERELRYVWQTVQTKPWNSGETGLVKYVIVGNSVAAIAAVEAIRKHDGDGEITVISDEPYSAYSRPLITYALAGKISEDSIFYRDKNFYYKNKVETILGIKVTSLNTKEKYVTLKDGDEIHFDKLLISTGGTPISPNIRGRDLHGVFTFTKLDDLKRVREYIHQYRVGEAVVVGGGLIGLKTAEALTMLKIKVSIVELADRILSVTFDKKASSIIERSLRKIGCEVITGNTVSEIKGRDRVSAVILKDGKKINCGMVILAIGVTPNIDLIKNTDIKVNRGILVDNHMQTNIPDIYAAGDVSECVDLIGGATRPIAIWPNAYRQGNVAGYNMAGIPKEYTGSIVMNSIELCNIPTISMGLTDPEGDEYEIIEHYNDEKQVYKRIVLKGKIIVGAIFISNIDRGGIYRNLIIEKIDVSSFKEHILKEDFGLISLPKEYRKHLVSGPGLEV
ncbi:NAD(P)/FAD-dependent oxidoreductase [Candidatus Bathyarchaeota archaeon]|nr:NAD(P)/FAD-dependent oxidoreductase [Candidatus Bathyarchaeota archaeon]MBS7629466.1 NAD(P)/FAD-dependent oxidoreductase [Candidatus Bathyarchaeota archaeon]